jgi:hypothetical protein
MDKMIIKLVGAVECNEGQHDELILDTDEFEEMWDKNEIVKYIYSRSHHMYYIESFKHIYTVLGDVYVAELDDELNLIKETKI